MDFTTLIPVIVIIVYLISRHQDSCGVRTRCHLSLGTRLRHSQVVPASFLSFAPIVDRIVRLSLRVEAMEVPAQDVVTRDNVTVKVNAVIYFRIVGSRPRR